MGELRKNICSLCGYNELVARTEDLKYLPPRHGFKEIIVCVKCDALSKSENEREVQQFNEYWQWAIRGTDPSIRPVTKDGVQAPIKARKVPKVYDGFLGKRVEDQGAAVTNFDKDNKPKPGTFTFTYKSEIPTDARSAYAKGWVRGVITGLMIAGGAAMTIYTLLH